MSWPAPNQVLGVYAPELVLPLAEVMHALGSRHVIVVHSHDGLDEISIVEPTKAAELKDGEIREIEIQPNDYGIKHHSLAALQVSDAKESLGLVAAALGGEPGPAADMVALNAGAAIYVSGRAESLEEGIRQAQDILATGVGLERLKQYATRSYAL